MEINSADIKKMTQEYESALSSHADGELLDRITVLEENQLDCFDCLLRTGRNGRTVNYLKNLNFRILNILSAKEGKKSYIPSVRTPLGCTNSLSRAKTAQLDIFVLLDRLEMPFSEKEELLSLENRKTAVLATL